MTQPDIEEICQVCIADVVVIGRIGRNKWMRNPIERCCSITLFALTGSIARRGFNYFSNPIDSSIEVACRFTQRVCFCEVPYQRSSLTCKCVTCTVSCYIPRTDG